MASHIDFDLMVLAQKPNEKGNQTEIKALLDRWNTYATKGDELRELCRGDDFTLLNNFITTNELHPCLPTPYLKGDCIFNLLAEEDNGELLDAVIEKYELMISRADLKNFLASDHPKAHAVLNKHFKPGMLYD